MIDQSVTGLDGSCLVRGLQEPCRAGTNAKQTLALSGRLLRRGPGRGLTLDGRIEAASFGLGQEHDHKEPDQRITSKADCRAGGRGGVG
jgi:hypothetical protein